MVYPANGSIGARFRFDVLASTTTGGGVALADPDAVARSPSITSSPSTSESVLPPLELDDDEADAFRAAIFSAALAVIDSPLVLKRRWFPITAPDPGTSLGGSFDLCTPAFTDLVEIRLDAFHFIHDRMVMRVDPVRF